MGHWRPPVETSRQEDLLLKHLTKVRKLFAFLRLHRHRDTGAGLPPCPPAQLAMATLLQGHLRASDAEAVELCVTYLRWQMVLDYLGSGEPPFSQNTLQQFRERPIAHDMDRVMLEHVVDLARYSGVADLKQVGRPSGRRLTAALLPVPGGSKTRSTCSAMTLVVSPRSP